MSGFEDDTFIREVMAANKSESCTLSQETPNLETEMISTPAVPPKDPVAAFRLVPDKNLDWDKTIISFFHTLFEVIKVVPIRNEQQDQAIREVVLVLSSKKNVDVLEQNCLTIGDCKFKVWELTTTQAEDAILKSKTKLYVGNIPSTADNSKVWRHFAKFGAVEYSCIVKKAERNLKGFGFVIFKDRESFEKALKTKHYIDGHRLVCKYFLNKTQQTRKSKDQTHQPSPIDLVMPTPHHCNQLSREGADIVAETQSTQDEGLQSDSSLGSGTDLRLPTQASNELLRGPYCSTLSCSAIEGLRFNVGRPAAYVFRNKQLI